MTDPHKGAPRAGALPADQVRARLERIIGQGIAAMARFGELLQNERKALESRTTAALTAATTDKQECLATLEELERERLACCADAGFEANGWADCLAGCDPEGRLAKEWQRYLEFATASNTANLTNGAIIRTRQQQISTTLAALCGGGEADTYGRSGTAGGRGSRALAEA
jgi:flagellar biosynthesis/type III secretory pathway chaperone